MAIFGSRADSKGENRSIDTVIGAEAVFEGLLSTKNSVCVEGTFRGTLQSEGAVILSRSGILEADVVAGHVSVNGTLRGNVRALRQLDVGETGVIHGDVQAASVTIAKGGVLEGTCRKIATEAAEPAASGERAEDDTVSYLRRKRHDLGDSAREEGLAAEA
ncbi:MAG: polymer-forming cytoskeletal protein [Deferrisomatales bacterium]|nr:polymer-forming cytoskeletal protein [Deferrisomatales bacterium]